MKLIAAMTKDRVIGNENKLLWHIPADFKHFKSLTSGCSIIMGRKTFESIGRPLPNRENIVISRTSGPIEGVHVVRSKEEAISLADSFGKDVFVIGGSQIYTMFLPDCSEMHLSIVPGDYSGDAHFPKWNESEWEKASSEQKEGFEYVVYKRKE